MTTAMVQCVHDINKLTCIDNTPTNGNVNDEHGHPWKLTTTQDYNKYMQYTDLGDRMMKLFDTMVPPPPDLTNPNSSSSCLPVEWRRLIEIFLHLVLMQRRMKDLQVYLTHSDSCFGKVTCPKATQRNRWSVPPSSLYYCTCFVWWIKKKKHLNEVQAALCGNVHSCFTDKHIKLHLWCTNRGRKVYRITNLTKGVCNKKDFATFPSVHNSMNIWRPAYVSVHQWLL